MNYDVDYSILDNNSEMNPRPKAEMTFQKAIGRFTQLFSRKKFDSEKEGDLTVRFNKAVSGTTELNEEAKKYVSKNIYRSTTYSIYSFVPRVTFNQFRVFYNLYFLVISILHLFPVFHVGLWWTSFLPLAMFLFTSMIKEGYGDYHRYKRDQEINDESFLKITGDASETIASRDICAGDLIVVKAGQRVPADMILFGTDQKSDGAVFIKTDQLDGETDWKLRSCIGSLKGLEEAELAKIDDLVVRITPPNIKIHTFNGIIERNGFVERLYMDNVIWGNSVLATGSAIGFVIYTGSNTKCALNIESPPFKLSLLESEANYFAKLLFLIQLAMTIGLTFSHGVPERWLVHGIMFLMILSYIVPISLRINLDFGKSYYAYKISADEETKKTVVRNPNVCEELGRISFLLTDKTGTLTLNEMNFKKLKTGTQTLDAKKVAAGLCEGGSGGEALRRLLEAFALCHNVSPCAEPGAGEYMGASTDEIALVRFAKSVGFELVARDNDSMVVRIRGREGEEPTTTKYKIIRHIPFTSTRKRMAILLRRQLPSGALEPGATLFCKGAEEVMAPLADADAAALSEEVAGLASEGLRTLVFASKALGPAELDAADLERGLALLGVSGVEDRLRDRVKQTFEQLGQAGVKVWMLTGDKLETAVCVGRSVGMLTRNTPLVKFGADWARRMVAAGGGEAEERREVRLALREEALAFGGSEAVLIVEGAALDLCLEYAEDLFYETAIGSKGVILCRNTPSQKARVARQLHKNSGKRVCAVGDGGNDVGMISAADVGVGIEGREGKAAALVADLAVTEFSALSKLLLFHGRNSYLRSASLAHLVFHRGLIVSVMQAVYSALNGALPQHLFDGWIIIGYTTFYTSLPLMCVILDMDIDEKNCLLFPEFYKSLQEKNESFSLKTFFLWVLKGVYQGIAIMLITYLFFNNTFDKNAVCCAFTALIFSELFNVAMEVKTWSITIAASIVASIAIFVISVVILKEPFPRAFVTSPMYYIASVSAVLASCTPVFIVTVLNMRLNPPPHKKVVFSE